jgi:serine/threonine protein kinase/predicted Zn-dependent protease
MAQEQMAPSWEDIDLFVEAYELSRRRAQGVEIAHHLPPPQHPHYLAVLRELVRVDLEYGWDTGRPRSLEGYLAEFPVLRQDVEGLRAIAFEEYRLRRGAGEDPSPEEYRQRFDVITADWPVTLSDAGMPDRPSAAASPGDAYDGLAHAAEVYLEQSACVGRDAAAGLERSLCSVPGGSAYADLLLDLHHADPKAAHRLAEGLTVLPVGGGSFLGFDLVRELGRGAFARVFLARQGELANRLVVLKLAIDSRVESQTLAQLQHTHIVPVYSAHVAPPLHALCMPYFGATTLADVREELRKLPHPPQSGRWLVQLLAARAGALPRCATDGTAVAHRADRLDRLEKVSYTDAVLWLGARLAEGLAHAHDRGIVHGDLKPANVLLSDEGRPMLLDFNLSQDTKLRGRASAALVGGTLPYMAPEQMMAFRDGKPRSDPRGDVYALGVLLFELLSGSHPFPLRQGRVSELLGPMLADRAGGSPDLRQLNPSVPVAVAAILRRCLEPDPRRRYPSARALQEDLDRQLANLPLLHAPDLSPRERLAKWLRRHPRLSSSYAVGVVATALLLALGTLYELRGRQLVREQAGRLFHHFLEARQDCQFLLDSPDPDPDDLHEGIARAEDFLNHCHVLEGARWQSGPLVAALAEDEREHLERGVREVLLFLAGGLRRQAHLSADAAEDSPLLDRALQVNGLAQTCCQSQENLMAVRFQRARLLQDAGREAEAAESAARARELPARTAEELLLLALERRERNEYRGARDLLQQAQHAGPRNPFVWYALGVCAMDLFDYREAKACFTTSIALWPRYHGSYHGRGRALALLMKPAEAAADYSEAIRLRPTYAIAYCDRGWAHFEQKEYRKAIADFDQAIRLRPGFLPAYVERSQAKERSDDLVGALADLTYALEHGGQKSRVLYRRSIVRARLGDRDGARADREELLRRQPEGEINWIARGLARIGSDPPGALADFDQALRLNPRSLPALGDKAHVLAERLGRTQEAIHVLDEVVALYPDHVTSIASRGVLHARLGRRQPAVADAVGALRLDQSPETVYQVAGIYALTSQQRPDDRREAFRLLEQALRQGYGFDLVDSDPELQPIRSLPEFRRLLEDTRPGTKSDSSGGK